MGQTLKDYKELSFIEEVKLTADEYRNNVTDRLINTYIGIMRNRQYIVDDKLAELISDVFKYIVKKRKVIMSDAVLFQDGKSGNDGLNTYVNDTFKYGLQTPDSETRRQYLRWVHERMSNGKTRKENIELVWYVVLKNKKWSDVVCQLNDVRKYLNNK